MPTSLPILRRPFSPLEAAVDHGNLYAYYFSRDPSTGNQQLPACCPEERPAHAAGRGQPVGYRSTGRGIADIATHQGLAPKAEPQIKITCD